MAELSFIKIALAPSLCAIVAARLCPSRDEMLKTQGLRAQPAGGGHRGMLHGAPREAERPAQGRLFILGPFTGLD